MDGSLRGRDVWKLNTQGCCFLCLKPNTNNLEVNGEVDDTEPELIRKRMSMRCLTRYLKVDLDWMEQATSSASTSKTGSKPEVDVEVDLCECCEKLASRFSSLFQQLEKVQMELEFCLGEIRHTVSDSSKTPALVQNYSTEMAKDRESSSQLVLVDKLRNEIRERGLKRGRTATVSLKRIERLPKQEVPVPVEDMDSADNLADIDDSVGSSKENSAAEESNNDCGQGLTPEVKKEPEDSSVIAPKKDMKRTLNEKRAEENTVAKDLQIEGPPAKAPRIAEPQPHNSNFSNEAYQAMCNYCWENAPTNKTFLSEPQNWQNFIKKLETIEGVERKGEFLVRGNRAVFRKCLNVKGWAGEFATTTSQGSKEIRGILKNTEVSSVSAMVYQQTKGVKLITPEGFEAHGWVEVISRDDVSKKYSMTIKDGTTLVPIERATDLKMKAEFTIKTPALLIGPNHADKQHNNSFASAFVAIVNHLMDRPL